MRKSREATAETRRRIVKTASHQFRENGIAETGLSDLMSAAGLQTQGGFYKHFESKDQLVNEAMAYAFEMALTDMTGSIDKSAQTKAFRTLVVNYLSPTHRDRIGEACPLSALGSELRRTDEVTYKTSAAGMKSMIAVIAKQIHGMPADAAKKKATAVVASMVGGIILSRIADSPALSNTILKDTRDYILQNTNAD